MSNINAVFQLFLCSNFDTFFKKPFNLEQNLTTCSKRLKNVYPSNVYIIQRTLFYKLDCFGIKFTSERKIFISLAIFDFESICVARRVLQRHIYLDTCPRFCIHFFKSRGRTNFPLQLWSSSPRCILHWSSWKFSFRKQGKTKNLFLYIKTTKKQWTGQRLGEYHTTSQSTGASQSGWLWQRALWLLNFYRYKRIKGLICRNIWNKIAMY